LCHIGAVPNCVTLVPYRIVSHWCRTELCHIGAVPNSALKMGAAWCRNSVLCYLGTKLDACA